MPDKIVTQDPAAYMREYNRINRIKVKATKKRWRRENPEKIRQMHRSYYQRNREKILAKMSEDYRKDKKKKEAHHLIRLLVKFGFLTRRPTCETCGRMCKTLAHHHKGYDGVNAINVIWLCRWCHGDAHAKLNAALSKFLVS